MTDPLLKPVVLLTLPSEGLAQSIVGVLESEGVQAWTVGGTPMEAPNAVNIMVLRADEELAHAVLETVRSEALTIDWAEIDVGDHDEDQPLVRHAPVTMHLGDWDASQPSSRSRVSAAGLGTVGAGAGLIGVRDIVFTALPAAAKPVPGCALVTAGVVWCVAKARKHR